MAEAVQEIKGEFTAEQYERLEEMHRATERVAEVFAPLSPWGSASRAIEVRLGRALRAAQGERLDPLASEDGRPDIHTLRALGEAWAVADALYSLARELNRRNPESTVASEIEDLAQRLDESKMGHPLAQIAKRSEDLDLAAANGQGGES